MNFSRLVEILKINFVKSMWLNLYHFGFEGLIKMPIIIQYCSSLKCKRGSIVFKKKLTPNMLTIKSGCKISVFKNGVMVLNGQRSLFNHKNIVTVFSGAVFEIGDNFCAYGQSEFDCRKNIKIGNNFLSSTRVMFMDTDSHAILDQNNNVINKDKEILVGDNVWIGYNVTVLKGTRIGSHIVIGSGSVLSGNYSIDNSVYAGNPAVVRKNNITWLH